MAQTARNYPVTFPYGATDAPYSPEHPHKGNDRKMNIGVPIVIGSTTVGYSGNTGLSGGPHLHTQAGTDEGCQDTVNPTKYEFLPGTVTAVRTTDPYVPGQKGGEWGKFVTIKTTQGIYVTYAHLSQVNVKVGQVIKGEDNMAIERGRAIRLLRLTRRGTSEKQIQALMQKNEDTWLDEVYDSAWFKQQTADMLGGKQIVPYDGEQLFTKKG